MIKQLVRYLMGGLGLVLPFIALAFLLHFIYSKVTSYGSLQSLGILIGPCIIGLIALGYARAFFGIRLFSIFESYLIKIPIIGPLYNAIKDVTSAFLGAENKFSEPVLVKFAGDLFRLGFITNKDNEHLKNQNLDNETVLYSVYFPLSFSLSGDLFLVPKDRIEHIDKTAKEAMQIIVSGGLINGTKR